MGVYTYTVSGKEYSEELSSEQELAELGKEKYFSIFKDGYSIVRKRLSNEQKGKLLDAICDYECELVEPDFSDDTMLDFAWDTIKNRCDYLINSVITKHLKNRTISHSRKSKDDSEDLP